jgi:hypothetical protein
MGPKNLLIFLVKPSVTCHHLISQRERGVGHVLLNLRLIQIT